jgi:hypothetical protein
MTQRLAGILLLLSVCGPAMLGCHALESCAEVPTTADGCREHCHDRGAEMAFFRYEPGTYRCDARCWCTEERAE